VERISETLTIDEIVEMNRQQIDMFGGLFLPVNNFHNGESLEYALEAIDASPFGKVMFPTLPEKAAYLAFSIITNHVFHDGNKRTAIATCRLFLLVNGFDLEIEQETVDAGAMEIACDVANNLADHSDLTSWVSERMRPLDPDEM